MGCCNDSGVITSANEKRNGTCFFRSFYLSDIPWIARLLNVVDIFHVVPMNGMSFGQDQIQKNLRSLSGAGKTGKKSRKEREEKC